MTINELLKFAVQRKASDVHLVASLPPMMRIDGNLVPIEKYKILSRHDIEGLVGSMLSVDEKERLTKQRELDISYEIPNMARFRVNLHFERGNMGLAARVVAEKVPTMEELAMPKVVYELMRMNQGLVLVTGPTGCGKSTSLAAMVDFINSERTANIITLEDPIEFVFPNKKSIIRQRQYGSDFISFPNALKHVLRQDPNVIMVGEMRDLETIAATITLAETGHLVLATLHTSTAAQTVDRIIDIFPPHQQNQVRLQISLSLRGVIAQQLLPKVGGGRIAAREILINNSAVANLIRENKVGQIRSVIETSAQEGMTSLDQDLKKLAKQELIAQETLDLFIRSGLAYR